MGTLTENHDVTNIIAAIQTTMNLHSRCLLNSCLIDGKQNCNHSHYENIFKVTLGCHDVDKIRQILVSVSDGMEINYK